MLGPAPKPPLLIALSIVTIGACALLCVSCSASDHSATHKSEAAADAQSAASRLTLLTDRVNGISFKYPENWTPRKTDDGSDYILNLKTKSVIFTVSIFKVESGRTLEKCVSEMIPRPGECVAIVGPSKILEQSNIKVGNQPAVKIVYTGKEFGMLDEQGMLVLVLNGTKEYVFSFFNTPETFDEYASLLQQILNSVQFLK